MPMSSIACLWERSRSKGPSCRSQSGSDEMSIASMLEQLEPRRLLSTFTVTNTLDSGAGSLRAAITSANATANVGGVPDIIAFALAGAGPFVIAVTSALPTITDPVDIDGYSQAGAIKNANAIDKPFNGVVRINLDGIGAPAGTNGLNIDAGNTTVQGLSIVRFPGSGIRITSNSGNVITGSLIGIDITGTIDRGNGNDGIQISGVRNNRIGGALPQHRNVISGNGSDGVEVGGVGSVDNLIIGNFIGTSATGDTAIGNSSDGVSVVLGASATQIGGAATAERNVIAGNGSDGIEINGTATTDTSIFGNYIGLDLTGSIDLGNAVNGIAINASSNNLVGGTAAGQRNVVSGNDDDGVDISNGAAGNIVQGNFLGTGAGGAGDFGNRSDGISILNSANTRIGGAATGAGNVIGGNGSDGIKIIGAATTGTVIEGNFIGIAVDGTSALGNDGDGVFIQQGAAGTTIGGTAAGVANRIGFNGQNGVGLAVDAGGGNAILANVIRNNVALGIDLGADGITANDAAPDADTGPNRLQNFPVLTQAMLSGNPTISGSLDSGVNAQFWIEFFSNVAGSDPSNHGEGQRVLGSVIVMTDAAGHVDFNVPLPEVVLANGDFITATATALITNDTSEFAARIVYSADGAAPKVTQVLLGSTIWTTPFLGFLLAQNLGTGGYVVPASAQLVPLPWVALNQIKVHFSEGVVVQQADLVLHGINTPTATSNGFNYDAASFTATWTFAGALSADKWMINLSDVVTDDGGDALDGEWTTAGSTFPSGNGAPGGSFNFRFNTLPGDANGTAVVLGDDVILTRNAQFQTTTTAAYSVFLDANGSGAILGDDVILVRNRQFTSLPAGEPSALSAPLNALSSTEVSLQSLSSADSEPESDQASLPSPGSLASFAALFSMPAASGNRKAGRDAASTGGTRVPRADGQTVRRGAVKNVAALIESIADFIDHHNEQPKSFVWTVKWKTFWRK